MFSEKKRIYSYISIFVCIIFVIMTVYSLWFGAKNTGDIITITDSYTMWGVSDATRVYHHSYLNDKAQIHKYHWLIDDSIPVRFVGKIAGFVNPVLIWTLINILCTSFMVYMLYKLISRWNRGFLRLVFLAVFPFIPAFFRGSVQLGGYVLSGMLLLAVVYIGSIKEASVVKWYLAITLCAAVVSFLPEFTIIVYIIPFVAYRDIKSNYNGGKAASHILFLLMGAIVIHLMFMRAFVDYDALSYALTGIKDINLSGGMRTFFCLDTKEKIGIYLPVNIMALVSLYGVIFAEKYARKYIYPGLFLYFWAMAFAGGNSYIITVIYPVLFFAFSQSIIHTTLFNNIKNALCVGMCVVFFVSLLCCANISYKNHTKGLNTAHYTSEYANLIDEFVPQKSTVMVVDKEKNLSMQMYAAYPRKTILSGADVNISKEMSYKYHPEYIVSVCELALEKYENIHSEEFKYVYRLKNK